MYILSPKTNFMGGALISASHLGLLCPGKLFTWKDRSKLLDVEGIPYKVISNNEDYKRITGDTIQRIIWCNDICCDGGYYDSYDSSNTDLWSLLNGFQTVILVNHQPINRVKDYLFRMINYLKHGAVKRVYIYNYRNWWNKEWELYLEPVFGDFVEVRQLPYHYAPEFIHEPRYSIHRSPFKCAMIGRTGSKCKIQSKYSTLAKSSENTLFHITSIEPDSNRGTVELLSELSKYSYIFTGYYYGGEGNPEQDVVGNHLEWSYMDSIFSGSIPITSSLFSKELSRLGLTTPVIDYQYNDIESIFRRLPTDEFIRLDMWNKAYNTLLGEVGFGNSIIKYINEYY